MEETDLITLVSVVIDEKVKGGIVPEKHSQGVKEIMHNIIKKYEIHKLKEEDHKFALTIRKDVPKNYPTYLKNILKEFVDSVYKKTIFKKISDNYSKQYFNSIPNFKYDKDLKK